MPWRESVWQCPYCKYETPSFYDNTKKAQGMHCVLERHIQVHHTCQYCGMTRWGKGMKNHEKKCKFKREFQVGREAMLLICLAKNETKQTPIATLTDDVLQCVFQHLSKTVQ